MKLTALVSTMLVVTLTSATAYSQPAKKMIAVLEFTNEAGLSKFEAETLADDVRQAALVLPGNRFMIMTRESMLMLLPPGTNLAECSSGQCEVEAGQKVGADLVISGSVGKFAAEYVVRLKLFDTHTAALLGSVSAGGVGLKALRTELNTKAKTLFSKIGDWYSSAGAVRATIRDKRDQDNRDSDLGFRPVRSVKEVSTHELHRTIEVPNNEWNKKKPLGVKSIAPRTELLTEEKVDAVLKTLDELIGTTADDDPSKPEFLARRAELYWDKAEHQKSLKAKRKWRSYAVKDYNKLLADYPGYPALDSALYYLGFTLVQMDLGAEAFPFFSRIVREFPTSNYVPNALLNIGEFYFNSGQMDDASTIYAEVENFPMSKAYGLAIYKKGWCLYNMGEHEAAMSQFLRVIEYTHSDAAKSIGYGKQLLNAAECDLKMAKSAM